MFTVYSCCQPIRLRPPFPPDVSEFPGEMDSMDNKQITAVPILTAHAPEHLSLPRS